MTRIKDKEKDALAKGAEFFEFVENVDLGRRALRHILRLFPWKRLLLIYRVSCKPKEDPPVSSRVDYSVCTYNGYWRRNECRRNSVLTGNDTEIHQSHIYSSTFPTKTLFPFFGNRLPRK